MTVTDYRTSTSTGTIEREARHQVPKPAPPSGKHPRRSKVGATSLVATALSLAALALLAVQLVSDDSPGDQSSLVVSGDPKDRSGYRSPFVIGDPDDHVGN